MKTKTNENQTRIIKLKNKGLNKINEKIQRNESITKDELNKLWSEFLK